jgi:hypothetical protein
MFAASGILWFHQSIRGKQMVGALYNLAKTTAILEENGKVDITGFPTKNFEYCVEKVWKTSQITKHLFNKRSSGSVQFFSFFTPDMVYVLKRLVEEPKLAVNRQALSRVIDHLQQDTWYKSVYLEHPKTLDLSCLKDLKKTLLPHQQTFLDRYDEYTKRYQH